MKPELGTMADLTADITPDKRARIDEIKREMLDAERGHELAALRPSQSLSRTSSPAPQQSAPPAHPSDR